jgi:hypothetical protein
MPSLEFLYSCARFGLGYGACENCGTEDVFDGTSDYNGSYFCRAAECTAAGYAKLQRDEEARLARAEQRRKDKEEWEAAKAAYERRVAEEDAAAKKRWDEQEAARQAEEQAIFEYTRSLRVQQPLFQSYRCECCNGETARLLLKKGELLCGRCAKLPSRA